MKIDRLWKFVLGVGIATALAASSASAQQGPTTADLKKDIDALQAAMLAIQKDLQDIKALLLNRAQAPAAPPASLVLDVGSHPFKGERTAALTLVEFSDYQCPFCARHVRETYPQIVKEYIETGKVKHVFMDYPLESIHPHAFKAAEAARCAGDQNKYWEMHDRLFANQKTIDAWTDHAKAVGLDVAKFESCVQSGKFAGDIRKDMAVAQGAGLNGTPAFFLAATDPASTKVKTLRAFKGASPFPAFKAQIDALLAEQGADARKN
jgi:protein-disulfide isomerase